MSWASERKKRLSLGDPSRSLGPQGDIGLFPEVFSRAVVLVTVALVLRLVLIAVWFRGRGEYGGLELGDLADHIVAGDGFVWAFYGTAQVPGTPILRHSFFPPFYPYLIALFKIVAGSQWTIWLQILQATVSSLMPLVVLKVGKRLMRAELAWVAAWIAALWPPFIFYSAEICSATFHTLAVPFLLLLLIRTVGTNHPVQRSVVAGLGYGIVAYSLPSFLGSLFIMPLGLKLAGCSWRRAVLVPASTFVVAFIVLSPWTIRNAVILDRFVPVATNLGFNLEGANNPYAKPWVNVLCSDEGLRWKLIDKNELETMNEVDFDRQLLRHALIYMTRHPLLTMRRMATRSLYYWWIIPEMIHYAPLQGWGGLVLMSILLPLEFLGLWVSWRLRGVAPWGVLYAVCVWATLFYMNFAIRGRYSLAMHPVMILFGVLGAAWIARSWISAPRSSCG